MGLRPTEPPEDAAGQPRRISSLDRVFKGVPYGPRRATKENEDAISRSNGINGLEGVFKGAVPAGRSRGETVKVILWVRSYASRT